MFVDGGESKKYDVDISKIYDFHFHFQQMFTNISNFADFFLSVQRTLSCLLSPVSCLLSPVSCLLSPVSRLLSPVFCLPSSVSCPHVSCLTSPMLYCKCCRFNLGRYSGFSNFMEQICGLGQFSNLNPLSGFRGLKANFFLADMKFSGHRHS